MEKTNPHCHSLIHPALQTPPSHLSAPCKLPVQGKCLHSPVSVCEGQVAPHEVPNLDPLGGSCTVADLLHNKRGAAPAAITSKRRLGPAKGLTGSHEILELEPPGSPWSPCYGRATRWPPLLKRPANTGRAPTCEHQQIAEASPHGPWDHALTRPKPSF